MFNIVFISYNEPNAELHWNRLRSRFPLAQRIHGVKGIHKAHKLAALTLKECNGYYESLNESQGQRYYGSHFWIVDGDSDVSDDFNFDIPSDFQWEDTVYVYKTKNPINDLVYGYGGIKLFPLADALKITPATLDMTTSISRYFSVVDKVASVTAFNTDPFNTWKSAFRECVKLSSSQIQNQDAATEERLDIWCSVGKDRPYGEYAIQGAQQGRKYGADLKDDLEALQMINNFDWLQFKFKSTAV